MKNGFLVLIAGLCLSCSPAMEIPAPDFRFTDPDAGNEKARVELLEHSVVKEFQADGIAIDCELSVCAKVSPGALEVFKKYKGEFLKRKDRIYEITFVKEDYPHFDYRTETAYIPAELKEEVVAEFFEVLNLVRDFESQVGFRIEFPSNRHLKTSIVPLSKILEANKERLRAKQKKLNLLVVSSVYNLFHPQKKVLMLKIEDLRQSFTQLWDFMAIFFQAQDYFGNVTFEFKRDEAARAIETMKKCLGTRRLLNL